MGHLSRRAFLRHSATLAAAGVVGAGVWTPWQRSRAALAQTSGVVAYPAGTTYERTIVSTTPWAPLAYNRLTDGPGWPLKVRGDLAEPKGGREERREAVLSFMHITDIQVPDAQSPARVEFLAPMTEPPLASVPLRSAHRPHETVVNHISEAAVRQSRTVGLGPVTGRPYDFAVSTGDNVDNMQENEVEWFLTLMNGGRLVPNSGAADRYEGIQDDEVDFYDPSYWHPHPVPTGTPEDHWKAHAGYPTLPGFLDAAIQPFDAVGVGVPWYTVYGNHDSLIQGNAERSDEFEQFAIAAQKVLDLPPGYTTNAFVLRLVSGDSSVLADLADAPSRPVTADTRRRFLNARDYIRAHLDAGGAPRGHGLTENNLDAATLYYTFEPAPGVLGISIDTSNRLGLASGSIGRNQLAWLEARLQEAHARWYDADGDPVTGAGTDQAVVIFGHHNIPTLTNAVPSPDDPERVLGPEVEALLHRYPNVVAYVNGHSHINRVWARPDPAGRSGGFWEISTCAQLDYPGQVRVLELVDNRDGTWSLFTTIVDQAGPAATGVQAAGAGDYGLLDLASLGRELAFNDPRDEPLRRLGTEEDLNVELLLTAPFERVADTDPGVPDPDETPTPTPEPTPTPTPEPTETLTPPPPTPTPTPTPTGTPTPTPTPVPTETPAVVAGRGLATTGVAAGVTAAVGTGLVAAGAAMRKAANRSARQADGPDARGDEETPR